MPVVGLWGGKSRRGGWEIHFYCEKMCTVTVRKYAAKRCKEGMLGPC